MKPRHCGYPWDWAKVILTSYYLLQLNTVWNCAMLTLMVRYMTGEVMVNQCSTVRYTTTVKSYMRQDIHISVGRFEANIVQYHRYASLYHADPQLGSQPNKQLPVVQSYSHPVFQLATFTSTHPSHNLTT